jgi:hypothetical protein
LSGGDSLLCVLDINKGYIFNYKGEEIFLKIETSQRIMTKKNVGVPGPYV